MNYFQQFLWILIQLKWISCDFDSSEYSSKLSTESVEDWLNVVNEQYYTLSHYAAIYTWEIGVNGNYNLQDDANQFGNFRLNWKNQRCEEVENLLDDMSEIQKRMIWFLCRGPRYDTNQAKKLSKLLDKMQSIYTETKICLPISFDICLNYPQIWDFTYILDEDNKIAPLNFSKFRSNCENCEYSLNLNFYDGYTNEEYYIRNGITNSNFHSSDIELEIRNTSKLCLSIDSDLEQIMQGNFEKFNRTDCSLPAELVFRWTWEAWRLAIGPKIKEIYPKAVEIMNDGARNNGYNDIGETWREELEVTNLPDLIKDLWSKIKPFYKILHAVLRNALYQKYQTQNINLISRTGPLPAHILGNMWSSDWSVYEKLLLPFEKLRLEDEIIKTNWETLDMVKRADDFYISLGLNPMTKSFWNNSVFSKVSNNIKCHGSAGNMFDDDDYRMVVCVNRSLYGLYEIIHEMGHIQYYMHLKYQPPLFQDSVNSALGEAIGDTIFLAMMTPQHLNRLRLIPDAYLAPKTFSKITYHEMKAVHGSKPIEQFFKVPSNNEIKRILQNKSLGNLTTTDLYTDWLRMNGNPTPNYKILIEKIENFVNMKENARESSTNRFDIALLLKLALMKIPQIPFEYILDLYRWDYFNGNISVSNANDQFWDLTLKEQGIHSPDWKNRHFLFDISSKFHFADNTPYVRYFLASILQAQIFKGLCEYTVFGKLEDNDELPMPLHRCDIYGSRRAGRLLKKAMKLGSSAHWSDVLYILTGSSKISVEPLLEFYKPLKVWLEQLIIDFDIHLGW